MEIDLNLHRSLLEEASKVDDEIYERSDQKSLTIGQNRRQACF